MIELIAFGLCITPDMGRRMRKDAPEADSVALHPAQKIMVLNTYEHADISVSTDAMADFLSAIRVERFAGLPVTVDRKLPETEIHFLAGDKLVGKITCLAVPSF
jgi:hypothetical protein